MEIVQILLEQVFYLEQSQWSLNICIESDGIPSLHFMDITVVMLVVKNKSTSLLWELTLASIDNSHEILPRCW